MVELKDVDEYIRKYREIAEKEMRGELAPRPKVESHTQLDLLNPERPYFNSINRDDSKYVMTFRLARFCRISRFVGNAAANILWYDAGRELGMLLVDKGLVKSVDDLVRVLLDQRIGIVDIVKESSNKMRVHVYECITCSGIPNIDRAECHFEGGVIAGVLTKLMGSEARVIETHCWGKGNRFCGFDAIFH